MQLTVPRTNGDRLQYVTGSIAEEVIGGVRLSIDNTIVNTIVTTMDASGTPKRRLTERYAVSLATATGGRFEVPDAGAPGGWRTEQTFELREIKAAAR